MSLHASEGIFADKLHVASTMFSYNEEKALPGTQVTFDTGKNTFTTSTFQIPAAAGKPAVKGSVVKDVKPVNAVSATVSEVIDI